MNMKEKEDEETGGERERDYLNLIMNDRSVNKMLKIRIGNHTLSSEIDRCRNRKT